MKLASIESQTQADDRHSQDPQTTSLMVNLQGVSKVHQKHGRSVHIFDELDLNIEQGEFVSIMGPSGSGKTTLLNLMGGLDRPSKGQVEVCGVEIDRLSRGQLAQWRATQVGFIFQFYNLLPVLNAWRNVELPLSLAGIKKSDRRRRAEAALQLVGLEDRVNHYPSEMSGGEQQRVAIARAIVGGPSLLLCDEPTGDLDRETGLEVMQLLQMMNREYGKTIVVVTHDPKVSEYTNRLIMLEKGELNSTQVVDHEAPGVSAHA